MSSQRDVRTFLSRCRTARSTLDGKTKFVKSLQSRHQTAVVDLESVTREINALSEDEMRLKYKLMDATVHQHSLLANKKKISDEITRLRSENTALTKELAGVESDYQSLTVKFNAADQKHVTTEKETEQLAMRLAQITAQRNAYAQKWSKAMGEMSNHTIHLDAISAEANHITALVLNTLAPHTAQTPYAALGATTAQSQHALTLNPALQQRLAEEAASAQAEAANEAQSRAQSQYEAASAAAAQSAAVIAASAAAGSPNRVSTTATTATGRVSTGRTPVRALTAKSLSQVPTVTPARRIQQFVAGANANGAAASAAAANH